MSLVPPRLLNKSFPKIVTGSPLLLAGIYLIGKVISEVALLISTESMGFIPYALVSLRRTRFLGHIQN